jgi:hypothetical protein
MTPKKRVDHVWTQPLSGVDRVWITLEDEGVKAARVIYKEEFGVAHDAPTLNRKLNDIFHDAVRIDRPSQYAKVPLALLAAVMLRERDGARRPGPTRKSPFVQFQEKRTIHEARKRKAALKSSMTAAEAEDQVVKEFSKPGRTKLSAAAIRRSLSRK